MTINTPHTPFDLVNEPWIRVLDLDGIDREVSLADVFRRAGQLRDIVGEVPTQSFAILRLLLAILRRAAQEPIAPEDGLTTDGRPRDLEDWRAIRENWTRVVANVEDYLDEWHDRFDLRHPETPFFQAGGLEYEKGGMDRLGMIIADVPNGEPFLTMRTGTGVTSMSWSEAARWLVHTQAYDTSGVRAAAKGDPRAKQGKVFPIGTGWTGQLGGLYLKGKTLQETLTLNLVEPETINLDVDWEADLPAWERPAQTSAPEGGIDGREPIGPVDLYTWQARRIRLIGDDAVRGVVLCNGDKIPPQNRFTIEFQTAWRFSDPQTKKFKYDVHMPRELDPSRSLWRGLQSLLSSSEPRSDIPPKVLAFAGELMSRRVVPDTHVSVRAVGIKYGSNNSTIAEIIDDHLELPAELVAHDNGVLADLALRAVAQAEDAARELARYAENLYRCAGGDVESTGPRDRARELAFAALEPHFRKWLLGLTDSRQITELETRWQMRVHRVVREISDDLAGEAGPAALVGRQVRGRHVDLGLATAWFRKRLADQLPMAMAQMRTKEGAR
ncbi:type I-E CRISPR-associated protein Cse1/CasA [Myceligenerans pegani]|uniref:Type I-E CRISPR-associated protein Cse1/CasA n=1 Tax=Myceligenerans pegani TaxID=2776917 RepID=A0ABR9N1D0_9MICO|nr:type I-E CRISPR-associated protein Cse1/CasA [Myceligenerans sp. TRM 65318]MBE1877455.1 type I-E CRISPR-associated protein Cse1/CasA [Myceligenerans sp. TRM 65318]MBE3019726.1 type I-E CRISPR-associated protein Cse1/CasA [Myceligenerans sp. TRM 65318]